MKPLIGITMNLENEPSRDLNIIDQDYGKAVLQAGGVPLPILGVERAIPDLVNKLDGFLFTGGNDIHPRFYKERPFPKAKLSFSPDQRVRFEIRLFRAALEAKKPILAVCYGAQLANVALGGTLYQDVSLQIPKTIKHGPARPGEKVMHSVSVFEGTKLCGLLNLRGRYQSGTCTIRVRSAHHQSVKNPGKGLRLAAVSPDGVCEALESRGRSFLIAVQWHPEKTPSDRASKKLFSSLISAARR
jgi:putative glutamine amidotransferase